jgi:hypothetical protein
MCSLSIDINFFVSNPLTLIQANSFLVILGFLIICIYFIYLFFNTLVNKNILGFSLTVFLFIILIAEHWVFSLHFGWIFFALITSFIFMESKKENILFSS